jgi:hypothetical protein
MKIPLRKYVPLPGVSDPEDKPCPALLVGGGMKNAHQGEFIVTCASNGDLLRPLEIFPWEAGNWKLEALMPVASGQIIFYASRTKEHRFVKVFRIHHVYDDVKSPVADGEQIANCKDGIWDKISVHNKYSRAFNAAEYGAQVQVTRDTFLPGVLPMLSRPTAQAPALPEPTPPPPPAAPAPAPKYDRHSPRPKYRTTRKICEISARLDSMRAAHALSPSLQTAGYLAALAWVLKESE